MILNILHRRGACSSLILYKLGEQFHYASDGASSSKTDILFSTSEEFFQILKKRVSKWDEEVAIYGSAKFKDYAFLFASTSEHQPTCERVLEEIGFQKSPSVPAPKNNNQVVTLWIMPIRDLIERAEKEGVELV